MWCAWQAVENGEYLKYVKHASSMQVTEVNFLTDSTAAARLLAEAKAEGLTVEQTLDRLEQACSGGGAAWGTKMPKARHQPSRNRHVGVTAQLGPNHDVPTLLCFQIWRPSLPPNMTSLLCFASKYGVQAWPQTRCPVPT